MKRLALTLCLVVFMGCAVRRPQALTTTPLPPLPATAATNQTPPPLKVEFSVHFHDVPEENQWNTGFYKFYRAFCNFTKGEMNPYIAESTTVTRKGREIALTGKWKMDFVLTSKWKDETGFVIVIHTKRDEEDAQSYTAHAKIEPLIDRADRQAQRVANSSLVLFADILLAEQEKLTATVQPP